MRIYGVLLAMSVLAPAARAQPVPVHATPVAHRPLARLRVVADRALTADPVAEVGRLPAPLGWAVTLGGFGMLGAALRGIRRASRGPALDPWARQ